MLISKNWLQDFIELPKGLTAEEIGHDLTMKTVEVEKVKKLSVDLEKVVVGVIAKIEAHPNADSLKVCQVDAGNKYGKLQIVCGGSNLTENMKVALALVGAKVRWHGEGEPVELAKIKLRGVESSGMICGSDEIGLADMFPKKSEKEILDLSPSNIKAGVLLSVALGLDDTVFDIDNKSMTHRSDLWGHYGIARELSAYYNRKLKVLNPKKISSGAKIKLEVKVENSELCPRYLGLVVKNIKVRPSPDWMQKRLMAIGVRPINNVVDITNYVMHELGQPMHAFDARDLLNKLDKDGSKKIIVRRAKEGEKFRTLDEKDYILKSSDLVIADEKRAVALAGVKGGENSGIKDDTDVIIFESANFNAASIRKTSTRLGLRTDSSARFEKSLDPELAGLGLRRAVELLKKILPETEIASSVVDIYKKKIKANKIKLSEAEIADKLGLKIPRPKIIQSLKALGFSVSSAGKDFMVVPPSWRAVKDITAKEDVIEEIARLYGYEKIISSLPVMALTVPKKNKSRTCERMLKNCLSLEFGFCETYNYSFVSPEMITNTGDDKSKYIELDNPVAKDRPYIRRNLLLNLLQNAEANLNRIDKVRLFEIGKTYILEDAGQREEKNSKKVLPKQSVKLGMVLSEKNNNNPFFAMSEAIKNTLDKIGVSEIAFEENFEVAKLMHPVRTAKIKSGGRELGFVGEINPAVQEKLGIPYRTAVCEMEIAKILECVKEKTEYASLSQFPSIERDIAFVVDKKIKHDDIYSSIKNFNELIENCELFDVFEDKEKIGADKKSMAYHIVYRAGDKTLDAKTVDEINTKVLESLKNNFGADIRK